ncbi:Uu.00g029180.m01.CDS01 [Anthostomella pinea]|uniref:Uu.00g029180.m01.CDS01 n=1 Tax=Anthostomella pinea TaxID=933095 RepID=A0AAI8V929_9PEZI|nr:Uu.00g029180.m01.CDS01 [Anthostomella pinea]
MSQHRGRRPRRHRERRHDHGHQPKFCVVAFGTGGSSNTSASGPGPVDEAGEAFAHGELVDLGFGTDACATPTMAAAAVARRQRVQSSAAAGRGARIANFVTAWGRMVARAARELNRGLPTPADGLHGYSSSK